MARCLPAHLRYASRDGFGVFLDLANGRYFALPQWLDVPINRVLTGDGGEESDAGVVAELVRRKLLVASDEPASGRFNPVVPSGELVGRASGSLRISLGLAVARGRAAWDLARRPLADVLAELAPPISTVRRRDILEIAASDNRVDLILGSRDRCLSRSLAFVRTCHRLGHPAQLVLGVRPRPFAAHAWAQAGDVVLNDRLDAVASFAPLGAWP